MSQMGDFQVPERFEVQELLVENDAEVVYRAVDRTLLREVILKRPGRSLEQTLLETGDADRALREARALAQVRHRGVVRLIDVIECPGGPLLVMEPIPGETLSDRLEREGDLPPDQVARLGRELAGALAAVHEIGAVHRGLSTANILIKPDGEACLAGFLFAKFSKASMGISSISYSGQPSEEESDEPAKVLPSHPAPEQLYGQSADARSDLFGLGCVLFSALTGKDPFADLLISGWTPPADPGRLKKGVPKALVAIILKCLARSPLGRYQSAKELEAALAELSTQTAAAASRPGPLVRFGSLAALVLVAVLTGFYLMKGDPTQAPGFRGASLADEMGPAQGTTGSEPVYSDSFRQSHALLIGISQYENASWKKLGNAQRDIRALKDELNRMGAWEQWDLTLLENEQATREGIDEALDTIERRSERDDRILIYFAGHGVPHEESETSGYLIPWDGKALGEQGAPSSWLHFDRLHRTFDQGRAKHILLAMDCCFGGRVGPETRGAAVALRYKRRFVTQRAHVILSAGRWDENVSDGPTGRHSPFAQAFLNALRSKDQAALTSTGLLNAIQTYCVEQEGVNQTPQMSHVSKASGDFVFFLKKP